jgi:hypothetical protein
MPGAGDFGFQNRLQLFTDASPQLLAPLPD